MKKLQSPHPKKVTISFAASLFKNSNPTKLLLFENWLGGSTLIRNKGHSHHKIMVNFKKIANQMLNL